MVDMNVEVVFRPVVTVNPATKEITIDWCDSLDYDDADDATSDAAAALIDSLVWEPSAAEGLRALADYIEVGAGWAALNADN